MRHPRWAQCSGLALWLAVAPSSALAQAVPWWVASGLGAPILAIACAVILAVLTRSWRVGLLHLTLVAIWVAWFWFASTTVTTDWVIWMPLIAFGVHLNVIIALIFVQAIRRFARRPQ